jgi:xanthine dehydrogenase accessory factor
MDIYEFVLRYLDEGKRGILATVLKGTGSTPRDVGTKMFVGEDGATFGTVGGGRLEYNACHHAFGIMKNGRTSLLSVSTGDREMKEADTGYGGNAEILLEPVTTKYLSLYRKIEALIKENQRGVIVTKFGKNVFTKSVIAADMSVTGDVIHSRILDWCRNLLYEKRPVLIGGILAEPLRESFPLYLFGSGYVSQSVSRIAKILDFSTTVIDDRGDFANRERFPDADAIMVEKFRDAFKSLNFSGREYLVVVTRSSESDAEVLEEAVKKPTKYVGMIGSKKNAKIVLDCLRQKGIDDAAIRRVRSPIGIPIHARTPQEIALSIVAELITVRNSVMVSQEEERMVVRSAFLEGVSQPRFAV